MPESLSMQRRSGAPDSAPNGTPNNARVGAPESARADASESPRVGGPNSARVGAPESLPEGVPEGAPGGALDRALGFSLGLSSGNVPEASLESAAHLLLDTLGVCIAAQPMQSGAIARDAAVRLYNAARAEDRATILFDGRSASRPGAAFAAATQTDNLDAHDGYNPTKGHVGVAVAPALIAVAEGMPDLPGREALAALVAGYEIAGRAGIALHDSVSDYHTSGAWNALGVAATAARLRGVPPEVLRHAWGIAEYHGPRSQMMREIANPTMLHDGSGMGALVGLSALELAEMGFTGAPALTIESPEAAAHWQDLGRFWQVEHQYIKPYPICRWSHAAIDAVRELRLAHGFAAEQIKKIEIRSFHNAVQLFSDVPQTTSQAQYSLAFAVAVMAAYGTIALEHISGEGLSDPAVADLVARTRATVHDRHEARYPEGRWADVTVTLKDGRILPSGDTHARGGPERPFEQKDIRAKFMQYAVPVLGAGRSETILDATVSLAEPGVRFADLAKHLYASP